MLSGLDPAHTYAAQVAAASAAGPSTISTSPDFTATGNPISCSTDDEACVSQDLNKPANLDLLYANYDLTGTDADTSGGKSEPLTATTSADPDPQCALPVADRVGAWVCPDPDTPSDGGGTTYILPPCALTFSCWARTGDSTAEWTGTVYYGWGVKTLGSVSPSIKWRLNGGRTYSQPSWRATGHTRNMIFSASLFNGAPGVARGGSYIRGSLDFSNHVPFVAPNTTVTWTYSHYDDRMWDHNVATEFSWEVPGYRGYWYFYVRSPSSHTTRLGRTAVYRFADPNRGGLPGDKDGHGNRY